jgi:hypothetical protein
MQELGSVIFAAGRPDEFQQNFLTSNDFISALEFLAPSVQSVNAMREHATFIAFEKRWQLPVYFQLRWKDIITQVEDSVSSSSPIALKEKDGFMAAQTLAVFTAIKTCWSPKVYINELGFRFWRLTLQLLSRYKSWVDSAVTVKELVPKSGAGSVAEKAASSGMPGVNTPTARSDTPVQDSSENTAADDASLKQIALLIADIRAFEKQVLMFWGTNIQVLLPDDVASEGESLKDTLENSLNSVTSTIPELAVGAIALLTRQASEPLQMVKNIGMTYRMSSRKRDPTEPSDFIPNIMRPLRRFFGPGGPGEGLKSEYGLAWSEEVFNTIATRYEANLTQLKKTEDSLKRFKQGSKKTGFSLFGGSSASREAEESKDAERIWKQMALDVDGFGRDAASLGVRIERSEPFVLLRRIATQNDGDGDETGDT